VTVVVFLVLIVGTLIVGAGFLRERLPAWLDGGEKLVSQTIRKGAEEVLPGVKERVKEVAPGLTEQVEKIIPGGEIPAKDVNGEEIEPIPRYRDMVRVSYAVENKKRIVSYKGKVEFRAASGFYQKEMLALGFNEKIVKASAEEEVYQYKKGKQGLQLRFRKIPAILSEITELTIKEF